MGTHTHTTLFIKLKMDENPLSSSTIDLDDLERWTGEILAEKELRKAQKREAKKRAGEGEHDDDDNDNALFKNSNNRSDNESPLDVDKRFPIDKELNRKIIFQKLNIVKLKVQAIVNPSNESLTSRHGVSYDIFEKAGPQLNDAVVALEGCKTGHAKLTNAFELPSTYIIHTVGPRYNAKYQTAAENALHNCYRNTLQVARESGIRSIALAVVNSQRKGYPPETGAHIALRTVRRFLEHYRDAFDTVVFAMQEGAVDYSVYRSVLPLYFPRTDNELLAARTTLPVDCGDEWGETIIEERKIRIAAVLPTDSSNSITSDDNSKRRPLQFGNESTMIADDELKPSVLAHMSSSNDDARQRAVRRQSSAVAADKARRDEYAQWLMQAEKAELADIARLRYIYRAGSDASGKEIVVLLGCMLPVKQVDLHRVLLYVVRVLAPLAGRPFSLVYIHGGVTSAHDPPFAWLRQLYGLLDYPHGQGLHAFYVVHPTFFLKVGFTLLSPFLSSSFNDKLQYINGLRDLFTIFPRASLQLPDEIFKADTKSTGQRWE